MGDMADDALEQIEEEAIARHLYRTGQMSIEEAMDRGLLDEQGNER